ncbi:HAMP domain-containing sensor histidine kinase [Sphingomonas sp. PAMC 26617]|uniref:HAMP domain-containing sensor histidine kinase n=1 Tax=Sphingomonas sp. PAMC 26617 TaxID=1112216 RepID=UPI000287DFFD|nr:HAMP domain-containing sensor histidine kinase [Sphingomonas sp. PAMC 26617]
MIRLSVTARIALLSILLALVSNLVLVAFVWKVVRDDAIDELRRDTIEQSDALIAVYRSGGLPALGRTIREARAPGDLSRIVAVIARDGRLIAGVGPELDGFARWPNLGFRIRAIGPPWSEREVGYAVRQIGPYRLVSGRVLDDWNAEQRGIERALAAAMLLSLALGVGGGLVVTRYVGRRLDRVADVIEGVAAGDLSRRVVNAASGDAFDRLATRLNAMLDKTERLMGELRIVTDGLAHDLRSPLARLRAKAEAAVLQADPAQREAAMGGLLIETDLVMRMLSTMIEITRAESVSRDRLARIDPATLVEEIADLYAPVVEDAGMRFEAIVATGLPPIVLHRELMTQAIANLIDNALRHAAVGGEIVLRLAMAGNAARFQVEDRGPGIAEADRAEALRRFGRLDRARSLPGAGLGMALVEAVARLHEGRVELQDNAPGLIAAIVVPISR